MGLTIFALRLILAAAMLFGAQAHAEAPTCNNVPPMQWLACLDAKPHRCNIDDLSREILAYMPVKDTDAMIKTLLSVRDTLRCRPSEE
jgi:hypothetical protein